MDCVFRLKGILCSGFSEVGLDSLPLSKQVVLSPAVRTGFKTKKHLVCNNPFGLRNQYFLGEEDKTQVL